MFLNSIRSLRNDVLGQQVQAFQDFVCQLNVSENEVEALICVLCRNDTMEWLDILAQ